MNIWGYPNGGDIGIPIDHFNAVYLETRMKSLANIIAEGKYDVYNIQELWYEHNYNTIKDLIPSNYHITSYRDFGPKCMIKDCIPFCKYNQLEKYH